jgi:hypothetical protein
MAVMAWRRLQERVQEPADLVPPASVLGCLVLCLALAAALPCAADQASSSDSVKPQPVTENVPTRSFTLPGSESSANQPAGDQAQKASSDSKPRPATPAPEVIAASLALAASSGDTNAEPHYKTAVLALKTEDLAVAAEEMNEAAKLAPENALILYGLAVVQARNQQPDLALPNMEKAVSLGLAGPESARVPDLLAAIRYAMKRDELEQKKVTPIKLWGSYETVPDQPVQEFENRAGKTIFKIRTPLSRQMFLWKADGETNVRGHWLEKHTVTEEIIFADAKRHDPKPKVITEEHWWLVTILINPDGSLDGSRIETCTREPGFGCEHGDPWRGKTVSFKGRVEPNGDLTITESDATESLALKKKSRVASVPPADVHIDMD